MKPWRDRLALANSLRSDDKKFIGTRGLDPTGRKAAPLNKCVRTGDNKMCKSIKDAI